eukprot:g4405.t1
MLQERSTRSRKPTRSRGGKILLRRTSMVSQSIAPASPDSAPEDLAWAVFSDARRCGSAPIAFIRKQHGTEIRVQPHLPGRTGYNKVEQRPIECRPRLPNADCHECHYGNHCKHALSARRS